jgi:hypothetical protein
MKQIWKKTKVAHLTMGADEDTLGPRGVPLAADRLALPLPSLLGRLALHSALPPLHLLLLHLCGGPPAALLLGRVRTVSAQAAAF